MLIKNRMIRRITLFLSLIMLFTSTINTTFGLIVTETNSLINTFIPFESIISNLQISKIVEHPFGEEYVIPEDIAFDFKVDFGSLYAKTTIKTTTGSIVADDNGSILVSVKPGNPFAVEGIDAGTEVTVTEIQKDGSGFSVKDGAATMDGIVAEDGSLKFRYVNVYTPASVRPANVFVSGTKILEGRDWQESDSFSFTLEQKQSDGTWALLSTKTITYRSDDPAFNQFDFSDAIQALTFDKVGEYHFRLTEVVGDLDNVDYDKSVKTFAIRVTDIDMDGKLEINTVTAAQNATVSETDGKYKVAVTFNNTYIPAVPDPDDIGLTITVNKTVRNTGDMIAGPEGFVFVLENVTTGENLERTSNSDGKAYFTLPFTAADVGKTYTYRLSETNLGIAGMTYDDRVYSISVSIALSSDHELIARVMMNGQVSEDLTAQFVNTYTRNSTDADPTGDDVNILFWFIMMIISGSACIFLVIADRKPQARKKQYK